MLYYDAAAAADDDDEICLGPVTRRPVGQLGWGGSHARLRPMWDKLRLRGMGAVFGRALVAPRWTSQQDPVVGNWCRLSASAGDPGAPSWWPGRDGRCQGSLCGEDQLNLSRELQLGQVGRDLVNTTFFSSSFFAFGT